MKVEQKRLVDESNWEYSAKNDSFKKADLVFVFGSTNNLKNDNYIQQIKNFYPEAVLIGCSTAGEISDINVYDNSIIVTAVDFDYTTVKKVTSDVNDFQNDFEAGKFLAHSFEKEKLAHIFILSDGLNVNGTELVQGLINNLPENEFVNTTFTCFLNNKCNATIKSALGWQAKIKKLNYEKN